MMQTEHEELKKKIMAIIRRSGLAISTQNITGLITLPEGIVLSDLLGELVKEGRLIRGCTLLVNGDVDYTYNLSVKPQPASSAAS